MPSSGTPASTCCYLTGTTPFLAAGTSPDPINWFDTVNETQVLAGQREFRAALARAGIAHEWREVPGGHFFRHDLFVQDLNGMLGRLRRAG